MSRKNNLRPKYSIKKRTALDLAEQTILVSCLVNILVRESHNSQPQEIVRILVQLQKCYEKLQQMYNDSCTYLLKEYLHTRRDLA